MVMQNPVTPPGTHTVGTDGPVLTLTIGSTTYPFVYRGVVSVRQKRTNGAITQQTGRSENENLLDSPWHIADIAGIGVAKANADIIPDSDRRVFEMVNIDAWPGMWCLGPAAQAVTDQSSTRRIAAFINIGTVLYYYGNAVSTAALEQLAYWTGSTKTWAKAGTTGLTAEWEAQGAGYSGFPVVGMAYFLGRNYAGRTNYQTDTATSLKHRQLAYQTSGAGGWTFVVHSDAGVTTVLPSGGRTCYGIAAVGGTLYALADSNTIIGAYDLRSSTDGVTFAAVTNPILNAASTPRAFLPWVDQRNNVVPTAVNNDGVSQYLAAITGTVNAGWAKILDLSSDIQTNTGIGTCTYTPRINGTTGAAGTFLIVPWGKRLMAIRWISTSSPPEVTDILASLPHGLPGYRQGGVLAVTATKNFVWFAIGGEDSSHTAGIYKAQFDGKGWKVWGPVYDVATAQKQVRAMGVSSNDDATMRVHFAEDTTAGGAVTTQKFFANPDDDPRFISGYLHTTATGKLILAKNDRDLPPFPGIWYQVKVTGQGITANQKVTAVYNIADGAPVGADGSWGTTLGAITASLGTVNFPGTPSGTGQAANAQQVRLDIVGASNASPYIESTDIFVYKYPAVKYVRVFTIDVGKTIGLGTVGNADQLMANIESVIGATTYIQASYGSRIVNAVWRAYAYSGFGFEPAMVAQEGVEQQGTAALGLTTPVEGTLQLAFVEV